MLKSETGFSSIVIIFVVMVLAATFSSFIIKKSTTPKQTIRIDEPTVNPTPKTPVNPSPQDSSVSQSSPSAIGSPLKFRVNVVIDEEEEEEFEREKESRD